jgi:hypothetical protein
MKIGDRHGKLKLLKFANVCPFVSKMKQTVCPLVPKNKATAYYSCSLKIKGDVLLIYS